MIQNKRLLVLWDVDHTLIETAGVGRAAYQTAFELTVGRPMERQAELSGRTEPEIFQDTLRLHDVDPSEEMFERFSDALAEGYRASAAVLRERGRGLPGAAAALTAVASLPDVVQTVLTGNIEPVARIKLATFGLDVHLDLSVGAYGSDDAIRANLVSLARQRAAAKYHAAFDGADTVIVGDSPNDIKTAQLGQASIVAVASGASSPDQLRAAGARIVLDDLTETEALIRAITGEQT